MVYLAWQLSQYEQYAEHLPGFPFEYKVHPNVVIERDRQTGNTIEYRADLLDMLILESLTTDKLIELYKIISDELEKRPKR